MKLRTLLLTVAVLAVLSLAAYYLTRTPPPTSADPRLGQSLIAPSALEKAAKLRLSEAGKSVTLARQPDATWRVTSYFDLPADFQKLSRFTSDLTDAKLQRLVTTNPERIARLDFKDTKIELLDSAGKPLSSVTLGKNADTGGRYIRYDDEKKAYLANLNAWLDTDSKNWADAQLLTLKPEDIAKIELPADAPSPLTLSREKKDSPWTASPTPANEKLKADKVSSLLNSLTGLRFSDTTEPTDPKALEAKQHLRTFKLTTFDKKTFTVSLGRKPEEKKLKPPTATTDGKTGLAALGTTADLAKKDNAAPAASSEPGTPNSQPSTKSIAPLAPEFETIPAGPVFVQISSSDASAPIDAEMQKRAFEVSDYVYTGLPQTTAEFFEPVSPPAPPAPAPIPASPAPTATKP